MSTGKKTQRIPDDDEIHSSVAVKIWASIFNSKLGVRMPDWMARSALANPACKNHAELSNILSEFSAICPPALTVVDQNLVDTMQKMYMQLKCDKACREKNVSDLLRADSVRVNLDGRVDKNGRPLDVCTNPTVMSQLWNTDVVYVARSDERVLDSAAKLIDILARKPGSRTTVIVQGHQDALDSLNARITEVNVPVFGTDEDVEVLSDSLPKISASFWCVTDVLDAEGLNSIPEGSCRSMCRNNLVVVTEDRQSSIDFRNQLGSKGYGRVFFVSDTPVPTERVENSRTTDFWLPKTDEEALRQFVSIFNRHDGSERSKGAEMFMRHVLYQDHLDLGADTKKNCPVAVLGVENRKNELLIACLRITARNIGTDRILMVLCTHDESVADFYRSKLSAFDVKIVCAPSRHPFLRGQSFVMSAYNTMMTSPDFWELVRDSVDDTVTHVLTTQDDGGVLRRVPDRVLKRWMQYDFIGAPWHQGNSDHMHELVPDLVGNGGISLRNIDAMVDVARSHELRSVRRLLLDDTYDMPEDVAFAHVLHKKDSRRVAPRGIAEEFSSEQLLTADSFALHKCWLYHASENIRKFLQDLEAESD